MKRKSEQTKIAVTPKTRGSKVLALSKVKAYFSENFRQSLGAEGVYYSPEEWRRLEKRLPPKVHLQQVHSS
ncbi:MAG: hypothetical protein GY862_25065 [Gammaproteobacteria bacterium]|nr:hypothetical protein [Gammaproteobacteria bacterium]